MSASSARRSRQPDPVLVAGCLFDADDGPGGRHLWVLVSDPDQDDARILIANFSTHRTGCDTSCLVGPDELPGVISRDSVIRYDGARITSGDRIRAGLRAGVLVPRGRVLPTPILSRVRAGFDISPRAAEDHVTLLANQGFLDPLP